MALFSFHAKTADGMDRNGTVEAPEEKEAIKKLQQEGLIVISIGTKNNPKMSSQLKDYLTFRKMITPRIIQLLFWAGTLLCVIWSLLTFFIGWGFIFGILLVILGPLMIRLWCELLILFFRINETLTEIKNNTERRA
jgi:type II secretory pathway component PulF